MLKSKHESFKEKHRDFVQKAEKVKKENEELKAALSNSRAEQHVKDAMIANAIREAEEAKEKEFATRMTKEWEQRETILQVGEMKESEDKRERSAKYESLKTLNEELIRKDELLVTTRALLELEERQLKAAKRTLEDVSTELLWANEELLDANYKYTQFQNTVRDHLGKRKALEESLDNLKEILD